MFCSQTIINQRLVTLDSVNQVSFFFLFLLSWCVCVCPCAVVSSHQCKRRKQDQNRNRSVEVDGSWVCEKSHLFHKEWCVELWHRHDRNLYEKGSFPESSSLHSGCSNHGWRISSSNVKPPFFLFFSVLVAERFLTWTNFSPKNAPEIVQRLMGWCFQYDASKRPEFKDTINFLKGA